MIVLPATATAEQMILTLTEKKTLTSGYYLFVFTNVTTKEVVNWIVNFTADTSDYPERYNEIEINVATVFANKPAGQWQYRVYEQASAVNTDTTNLRMLERGKMLLQADDTFTFTGYAPETQYKGYGG